MTSIELFEIDPKTLEVKGYPGGFIVPEWELGTDKEIAHEPVFIRARKGGIYSLSVSLVGENPPKVGERWRKCSALLCRKILYEPRKWWQFWKKKEPLVYEFECVEEV